VVNVHIHQFKPGGAVVDAGALAQFQQQWATYRKLIASNDLSHREVGAILQLNEAFASPFTFLDIACGDASMMKTALRGTKVRNVFVRRDPSITFSVDSCPRATGISRLLPS
jgi:hypothetical protein